MRTLNLSPVSSGMNAPSCMLQRVVNTSCRVGLRLAVLSPIALCGCAGLELSPQAGTPRVNVPAHWSQPVPVSIQHQDSWWKQWGDAQLDRLIREALSQALDIQSAQAKLRQARAARDLAQANWLPSLGVSAASTRSRSGRDAGGNDTAQTRYNTGFDASWELPIWGALRDATTAADADADAAAANVDATRISLVGEVALNYTSLRAYQERLRIAQANLASQEETLQITQWREQAGLASRIELEQARSNLEQTRASIPSLDYGRAQAEHRLALLVGQPPGALHTRLATTVPLPLPPQGIAVGIPADTLRQRPDVRAAELSLRAEIARSAQRAAEREPSLTLSGSFGWQAVDTALLGGRGSLLRSLAATLSANLFDGGRIRARFAAQDAVREQTLIAYEKAILTAIEDVENALSAYAAGQERVAARRDAAQAAGNAAQLAHTQYRAGLVDFQKVLDTDRTQLSAQDALVTAQVEVLTATISLYKALGGGWRPVSESPAQDAEQS
jgi:multidrug efflux system outer membrane protein